MRKWNFLTFISILLLNSCVNEAQANRFYVPIMYVNGQWVEPLFTPVSLIMYYQNQLDECKETFTNIAKDVHKACDRDTLYFDRTNIKTVNDAYGTNQEIELTDELFDILKLGIDLTKLTKGSFNLAMGSLIDVWDGRFALSGSYGTDPENEVIEKALTCIPSYEVIDDIIVLNEEKKTVKFNTLEGAQDNVVISLGGLAKGYAVDKARDFLLSKNYSGIISAGSSSLATVLDNPLKGRNQWTIAITAPLFYYNKEYAVNLNLNGTNNLSTSGDYEQNYLLENDDGSITVRHHILNPNTGYSSNYHRAVTLYSPSASSAVLDALSTAIMNYETIEEINEVITAVNDFYDSNIQYCIFDDYDGKYENYSLKLSSEFKNSLSSTISERVKEIIETK